jgi:cell division protein ZapA
MTPTEGKLDAFDVTILDREFRVTCPVNEREELLEAVAYLDRNMREIRDAGKINSIERIAITAALNITHELLTTRIGGGFDLGEFKRRMGAMQAAIEESLAKQDELF